MVNKDEYKVADLLPVQRSRPCWIQPCCQCTGLFPENQ